MKAFSLTPVPLGWSVFPASRFPLLTLDPSTLDDFERAVLPYMDDAYTLARYLMRHEHDAQDIVQEAYLRALRHYDPYGIGDPRAWLLTIVRHCCFSWKSRHRADAQSVEYDDALHAQADPSPNPEALTIAHSTRDAIHAALDALPTEFREVIVLREIEGLAYRDIAQVVGIPIGTVMSRLARARRRLQDMFGASSQAAG